MEISEMFEEINKIKEENKKYLYSRERLEQNRDKLRSLLSECIKILDEMTPNVDIKVKNRKGYNYDEMSDWVEQKLGEGLKISREMFLSAFPNAGSDAWNYIICSVSKQRGWKLKKQQDGRKKLYYI